MLMSHICFPKSSIPVGCPLFVVPLLSLHLNGSSGSLGFARLAKCLEPSKNVINSNYVTIYSILVRCHCEIPLPWLELQHSLLTVSLILKNGEWVDVLCRISGKKRCLVFMHFNGSSWIILNFTVHLAWLGLVNFWDWKTFAIKML